MKFKSSLVAMVSAAKACTLYALLASSTAFAQLLPITIGNTSGAISPPYYAADGQPGTSWNSGGPPTQWIDIDLQQDRVFSRLKLLPEQWPAGNTVHNVYGRTNAGQWIYFGSLQGYTSDNQWLQFDNQNASPVRFLVIQTTQGPSWVAWREFQVYDGGALHYSCTTIPPGPGWVVTGRTYDPSTCSQYQDKMLYTHRYLGNQPSGVIAQVCITANMPPGWTMIRQERNSSYCWDQPWPSTNVFWYQKN